MAYTIFREHIFRAGASLWSPLCSAGHKSEEAIWSALRPISVFIQPKRLSLAQDITVRPWSRQRRKADPICPRQDDRAAQSSRASSVRPSSFRAQLQAHHRQCQREGRP